MGRGLPLIGGGLARFFSAEGGGGLLWPARDAFHQGGLVNQELTLE